MNKLNTLARHTKIPVIGAPMFIVSNPKLVVEQCVSGIIGSFPALNARNKNGTSTLDEWLSSIKTELDFIQSIHKRKIPPFAVNQIVHHSNTRLMSDMETIIKYRVPIVITSLGAKKEINDAVHSYGGFVFHDVTTNTFAKKAIEKGADGLIAVAAGAGGHAGMQSPFALVEEIRQWYNGPLVLSGSISSGRSIAAALKMGANMAYIGSPFIATKEANASIEYKTMVINSSAEDICNTDYFTGIHGNYLKPSIEKSGINIDMLNTKSEKNSFLQSNNAKAWSHIWGCGQGIGNVQTIMSTQQLVHKLQKEYDENKNEK